jgi:hypothetical protein
MGERKLGMARALHAGGFSPEPLELVHGFLVEHWHGEARKLHDSDRPVEGIGRYVGARAQLFPAAAESGASIEELIAMCRRNISLAFGNERAAAIDRWDAAILSQRVARVRTDNKLDRCEWLRLPNGRLLKTDALDHHQGHDLIGCQDMAWDVAGAVIEFDLSGPETDRLVAATGYDVDPDLLAFCCTAYAAFRLGRETLAGARAGRYRRALLLQEGTCPETAQILG